MDLSKFDWGWMSGTSHQDTIIAELSQNIYQKVFKVEPGDIVLDLGASVGIFPFSVKDSGFKHMFCFEPSSEEFPTLVKNTLGMNVSQLNIAITNSNGYKRIEGVFGESDGPVNCKSIQSFCYDYGLKLIDFMKMDIEGHEYDIFHMRNVPFLKNNVRKIVGEFHLKGEELNTKFIWFRDNILQFFDKVTVFSIDGTDITWNLYNKEFTEYYTEVIIYIDNR